MLIFDNWVEIFLHTSPGVVYNSKPVREKLENWQKTEKQFAKNWHGIKINT